MAHDFRATVRGHRAEELYNWPLTVDGTALAGFATGLKRDLTAVRTALSLPWNTESVEGQFSRLKTVKRMMNGSAASIC